jgi:hypothetical protein
MGPPVAGVVLDVAMLVASGVWLAQHPFVQPYVANPSSIVSDATSTFKHLSTTLQNPQSRKLWGQEMYDFVLGDDLGSLAATNPGLKEYHAWNEWKNSLFLPESVRNALPHTAAMWLRNYVAIHIVYFGGGLLWAAMIYKMFGHYFFPPGTRRPSSANIWGQIGVSVKALPFYCMMPTIGEWLAEKGWTRAFASFEEVGGFWPYLAWTCLYLFYVEWAIYWCVTPLRCSLHSLVRTRFDPFLDCC